MEHFKDVLNREEPHNPIAEDVEIDVEEVIEDISVNGPSKEEVQTAIKKLRNGKSPEIDSIAAESLKADVDLSGQRFKSCWRLYGGKRRYQTTGRKDS